MNNNYPSKKEIDSFVEGQLKLYKCCYKTKSIDIVSRDVCYTIACKPRFKNEYSQIIISKDSYDNYTHDLIDNKGKVYWYD